MSTLSSRLYGRAKRMESGRHQGGIKVETVRAMAKEAKDLEHSREYLLRRNGNLEDANQGLRDMHQTLTGQVARADDDQRKREKYIRFLQEKNAAAEEKH